jgi:hypothetical protein
LSFFEILKFRQGGDIGVFVKISIFQKCPKFIILQYNELFIIIYNVSVSGVVKFPIFGDSFIFTKFWKNEFFWKKFLVALVLEGSPMLLTNTRFNLQYPSRFSWFRKIWIFSKFWNFVKGVFVKNSTFQKCPNFIIPLYKELFIIICKLSVSGIVKFPIFEESFIFTKF